MAGVKISALPAVPSALPTDIFPVVQGGITYKETSLQLATAFGFTGGILGLSQGGTGANLTASLGGVVYSTASAMAILSGIPFANRFLISGAGAAPTWSTYEIPSTVGAIGTILRSDGTNYVSSTATFADTYSINSLLYASGTDTITELASVSSSALVTDSAGVPTWIPLDDGQIIIGSTVGSPVAATLTAGAGITISNGSNSITISGVGSGGVLPLSEGGTNANLTASLGGIVYSTATAMAILSGIATANRVLVSGATAAPTWSTYAIPAAISATGTILRSNGTNYVGSTSTFADTYTINSLLYAGAANTVIGLATANRSSLSTTSAGVPTWLPLLDGQVVIGSTAGSPAAATLAAGPGISIANASNTITISGVGGGIGWTEVTGTTQAMTADNGYIANNASLVTLTLPATMALGQQISVIGKGAGGWKIAQAASQQIRLGSSSTTLGTGGSLASTNQFDSLTLVCTVANTTMTALSGPQGIITVV